MLKKMTLLAMAIGALVAFAIPAVASADKWTLNGNTVGGEGSAVEVDGQGTLSATLGEFELGPCLASYHGEVWNAGSPSTGVGRITDFDISAVHNVGGKDLCQVWLVKEEETVGTVCDITSAFTSISNPPFGAAWPIAVGANTSISITGANFTDIFSPNCPLGEGGAAEGIATGTIVNSGGSLSISLNGKADDMKTPTNVPVDIDGSVSLTATTGTLGIEN